MNKQAKLVIIYGSETDCVCQDLSDLNLTNKRDAMGLIDDIVSALELMGITPEEDE